MKFAEIVSKAMKNGIRLVPHAPYEYLLIRNNMKAKFACYQGEVHEIVYKNDSGVKTFTNVDECMRFMNGNVNFMKIISDNKVKIEIGQNQIQIVFNYIPEVELRTLMKDRGFRFGNLSRAWWKRDVTDSDKTFAKSLVDKQILAA